MGNMTFLRKAMSMVALKRTPEYPCTHWRCYHSLAFLHHLRVFLSQIRVPYHTNTSVRIYAVQWIRSWRIDLIFVLTYHD